MSKDNILSSFTFRTESLEKIILSLSEVHLDRFHIDRSNCDINCVSFAKGGRVLIEIVF